MKLSKFSKCNYSIRSECNDLCKNASSCYESGNMYK